ncbi:MAG: bifunctional metallophosphatase/5'-nucleotidase [Sphingomonadales bacterium]|jgi:5'-nucleotidase|nr:bifunctional metallophosphatase/5'-nucleotidase [Sphingomonadales bacterium]MBK9003090.1 bifunctional metallophosphatase/5'-nucleotidase [Sphingomonadales bacterium]MBK9268338.1 bifunctional metallophosphatase/5'-nucleotidase [Sphingomonadales bacterium]
MKKLFLALTVLSLPGCASTRMASEATAPLDIRIIGINDFHGHLDPPRVATEALGPAGEKVRIPSGGVAYLASAIDSLKADAPHNVVVGAGDLIGASPLSSSLFLDEPSIMAMDMAGLEFNAVGNHEFDRGTEELQRMQSGGCAKFTQSEPCRIDKPFPGAKFRMLAANTKRPDGSTLFAPYALKTFGSGKTQVTVGFIGMTLEGTANLVSANRIRGIHFADEADTANALVPQLKAAGADVIVVLIHEGASNSGDINNPKCDGVSGTLLPILDRLDPAVDVVVSGHTHQSYVCDYSHINPARPILLTSAGSQGRLVTGIDLKVDPASGKVLSKTARNIVVQSEAFAGSRGAVPLVAGFPTFAPRADLAALVARYRDAAKADESRIVGALSGAATRDGGKSGESLLGNLIADAQLAATEGPDNGRAQIAFMNPGGLRADVLPGANGKVTFGSVFAAQPFGNTLVTKTMTGKQIRDLLEQQFNDPAWVRVLSPSSAFRFGFDLSRPIGQRVVFATLNGTPLDDAASYRVTVSDFLSNGGDAFSLFKEGTSPAVGPTDLEALIAWLSRGGVTALPALDRIENKTPQ